LGAARPLPPSAHIGPGGQSVASPAVIDRECTKFSAYCWLPFKSDIPLLFRHDQNKIAGKIEDLRIDDRGLYVRARVTDPDAKRCAAFSVGATIHNYIIREDHAQVTSATLDEISLTDRPSNPLALVAYRLPPSVAVEAFDLYARGINKAIEIVELLRKINARVPRPEVLISSKEKSRCFRRSSTI
jgi:Caudovirus prohead serine protease